MPSHNCFNFPTSFNIVHYVNHYLNLACCNIICIFLWAYCHNNISPVAPKLIKHSTSYIFLPLSLVYIYIIRYRAGNVKKKRGDFCKKTQINHLTLGQNCVIMALYTLKGMRIILIWGASGRYHQLKHLRTKHFFPDSCFSGDTARQMCGF